jgi:hypothetical protein
VSESDGVSKRGDEFGFSSPLREEKSREVNRGDSPEISFSIVSNN